MEKEKNCMEGLIREIDERRAKRALQATPIPEEVINRLLKAATYAPSCFNNQPWRIIVTNSQDSLDIIKANLPEGNYWVKQSPLIFLFTTKNELDCQLNDNRNYALFDLGLAAENLILQAVKEGLIAHPIAGFKPVPIKEALGIPQDYTLIVLIVTGYPGEITLLSEKDKSREAAERVRKPDKEVIMYNRWIGERDS
ncbi:MAG: nitroreductase family protein [Spirochaetota bacterium]